MTITAAARLSLREKSEAHNISRLPVFSAEEQVPPSYSDGIFQGQSFSERSSARQSITKLKTISHLTIIQRKKKNYGPNVGNYFINKNKPMIKNY